MCVSLGGWVSANDRPDVRWDTASLCLMKTNHTSRLMCASGTPGWV